MCMRVFRGVVLDRVSHYCEARMIDRMCETHEHALARQSVVTVVRHVIMTIFSTDFRCKLLYR